MYFQPILKSVLMLHELSPAEFRAFCLVMDEMRESGNCFPSNDRLAYFLGVEPRMVRHLMKRLDELDYVKVSPQKRRAATYSVGAKTRKYLEAIKRHG
jgi:Mn-dependent DtxR family transcriptional regulator